MSKSEPPKYVTALFSFKGKNNDELCFKKGDVVTITQVDDEGWWEGTLHDKTGWFPSNYVKEYRPPEPGLSSVKSSPEKSPQESPVHQKLNRDIVLKDIVDSEKVNVAELQGLLNNFLHPLEAANILKKEEYKQLLGNVHEVLEAHQRLLTSLESTLLQGTAARIGNLFLTLAPRLKTIHTNYCNNHPQAVCILDRYRDELNEFMEHTGAIAPGILVLTTGLSKPFRRLDKYSGMLQELERYTEKNHPDRGDTQRGIAVYRDIAECCASIRKQRELALQVLTSGIKGWEGEELSSLGEILHVGAVTLATGHDRRDRYFVLFPSTLLVLSTSARMSSFVYEGKLPLTGITVTQSEDTDDLRNAFEISGPMIESIVVLCATKDERQRWIELLGQEPRTGLLKSPTMPRVSYNQPPYARLSRFFARLVKKKIIHADLVKKLLYIQYVMRPDLSGVKMRRRNITTYAVIPARPSQSRSRSSSLSPSETHPRSRTNSDATVTETEEARPKPRVLRKSTLKLDVKYAVGEIDLRTVGVDSETNSFANYSGRAAYEDPSTLESSKSLPVSGHHEPPAACSDFAAVSFPCTRHLPRNRSDANCEHTGSWVSIHWKTSEFSPKEVDTAGTSLRSTSDQDYMTLDPNMIGAEFGQSSRDGVSMRSSDSGMAESYRFYSSDINSSYKSFTRESNKYTAGPVGTSCSESENDENKFEHQCICTSPFGSTPRDSTHSSDMARNVDDAFGYLLLHDTDPEEDKEESTSPQTDNHSIKQKQLRFTQPIPYAHQCVVKKAPRKPARAVEANVEDVPEQTSQTFTSGLYAHWWFKKTIPLSGYTEQAMLCEMNNPLNGKLQQQPQPQPPQQRVPVEPSPSPGTKNTWSIASLRPAPPLYTLKSFDERQFEEDAIILRVIEGYCLSVNSRFTVHSGESSSVLDYDSQKSRDRASSLAHNRGNWDMCNRTLSETVRTLKSQMTDLQSQMSLLTKQLDEERRSRLSLAAIVKRSMGVID